MASTSKKNNTTYIPSAVLVPVLIPQKNSINQALSTIPDDAKLLFTVRTQTVEHHKGQISFPGGKFENTDQSLLHTALRETHEEIGIEPSHVKIIQELENVPIQRSGFVVSPFVGIIHEPIQLKLSVAEIDSILEVPIQHFLDPKHSALETIEHQGFNYTIKAYYFNENRIWGATAVIVDQLLKRNQLI